MTNKKLRVAMLAWEIGRVGSGLGAKIGGLGTVLEELPQELVKAAKKQGIELEIEILSPCFAYYDKSRLTKLDLKPQVVLEDHAFCFDVYEYVFDDGQKAIYFCDDWQLKWTIKDPISNKMYCYPDDPQLAVKLYASVCQAMAVYIKQGNFDIVHLHDYHVGLVPFYLGDEYLRKVPVHLTIHNATYQGIVPLIDGGYSSLDRINLPGEKLFHKYFDFFDHLNLMKACMLKVHEIGGKITTVSGDIEGSWGYAAELRETHEQIWAKAYRQKNGSPIEVFVPNRHMDLFEKLPIAGITNGMSDRNRPENMPELKADFLQKMGTHFKNATVQTQMLTSGHNHNFDANHLEVKAELKRLLHLEAFNTELVWDPILFTLVGRMVDQKNFELAVGIIERALDHDAGVKFIILAAAEDNDPIGKQIEDKFRALSVKHPNHVYFNNTFNQSLSKLIMAGGDFTLIPSKFEPCGLVDLEASLLGNIVIGHAIGGLIKVRHCAYLYEWLDIGDRDGEASAFFSQVKAAIDTYRNNRERHIEMIRKAMTIDASWDKSAKQYIDMYMGRW